MPEINSFWQQAHKQAKQVKNEGSKRRQIVLLCETLKKALKK